MKQSGFTLIELMIVVVIIGVLAALAYPSFSNQVDKTRRADAKTALLGAAQELERCFTRFNDYRECGFEVGTEFPSPDGFYLVTPTQLSATAYELTAVPEPPQTRDALRCTTFVVRHTGAREATGTLEDQCWD